MIILLFEACDFNVNIFFLNIVHNTLSRRMYFLLYYGFTPAKNVFFITSINI